MILNVIASYKALWQIIFKPFFWEKTIHGVSKKIKFFNLTFLIIFLFGLNAHSINSNNIVVQCEEKNFRCKSYFKNKIFDANIGKNGLISKEKKIEGDLSTPTGNFKLQNKVFYKNEKIKTKLLISKIQKSYKWCDDPKSKIYNKFFILNEKTQKLCKSYEDLLRNDDLYDFIIPIKYNTNPPIPYKGSAIFIHAKRSKNEGTAGCIAFEKEDLKFIIKNLNKNSRIIIKKVTTN